MTHALGFLALSLALANEAAAEQLTGKVAHHVSGQAQESFHPENEESILITPLSDGSLGGGFSAVKGVLDGYHAPRVNARSQMSYYILEGNCGFSLAERNINAGKGDLVTIPPHTPYAMQAGYCEMLIIATPPFDAGTERRVDSLEK